MGVSVLLADDHPVFRQGLRALLEREKFEILGEASDGLEAIVMAERLQPAVVVIDLAMPALNGIDAAREIVRRAPRSKVILLTMYTEEHHVLEALRAGVKGCVSKSQAAEHLLQSIKDVCAGGVYLSPHVSGAVVQAYLAKTELPYEPLTPRERQVLQLIAEGDGRGARCEREDSGDASHQPHGEARHSFHGRARALRDSPRNDAGVEAGSRLDHRTPVNFRTRLRRSPE